VGKDLRGRPFGGKGWSGVGVGLAWTGEGVDRLALLATIIFVQVVLRKLGRGSRAVSGRLVRAPRKGSVIVIEFSDGMHEYVTTAVKRVLRLAQKDVFYIETVNSRYRLEVRERDNALDDVQNA